MGFINLADKTINAKLVYYGVGMGGKTTSLQAVHAVMCPRNEVQLVSIKTEEDSTLLFDFLPINLGQVEGFKIRIQGFTVPGQPKYRRMRKYVLSGADAVVFVVDSERSRAEENQQSFESLKENLKLNGLDPQKIPLVLQYNKRDLDDILPEEELDRMLRFRPDIKSFPSVATDGQGVFEAFVETARQLVEAKVQLYGLGKGEIDPKLVAESAARKLWEIHDAARREAPEAGRPELAVTVAEELDDSFLAGVGEGETPTAELDLDLDLDFAAAPGGVAAPHDHDGALTDGGERDQEGLLDRAVQSNLDLATSYGQLDEYRLLLERKNRELVKVAQNTVHDLNRPLSAIKLLLNSVRKGYLGQISDKVQAAIDNGLLATRQMERLIGDLMDSSRLDFDGIRLVFKDVDMALLLAEVVQCLRPEIAERNARIVITPMPVVSADEWALSKVFMNLIGNALQYARPDRRPEVTVTCEEGHEGRRFTIADNGIGIPQKDLGRLFRRFERGSNTGGISGTGLGLHIIKEVVTGHGGTVWVESTEGKGTKFHLEIPNRPVQPGHSPVSDVRELVDA